MKYSFFAVLYSFHPYESTHQFLFTDSTKCHNQEGFAHIMLNMCNLDECKGRRPEAVHCVKAAQTVCTDNKS